jgi:hypothetical protein
LNEPEDEMLNQMFASEFSQNFEYQNYEEVQNYEQNYYDQQYEAYYAEQNYYQPNQQYDESYQ